MQKNIKTLFDMKAGFLGGPDGLISEFAGEKLYICWAFRFPWF